MAQITGSNAQSPGSATDTGITRRLCERYASLLDLPNEFLVHILRLCLIETGPIVDPWKEHPQSQLQAWKHRKTFRDITGRPEEEANERSICPRIMATNSLLNRMGREILYGENDFVFTCNRTLMSFCDGFPATIPWLHRVTLVVFIGQSNNRAIGALERTLPVQEFPHGPWLSSGFSVNSWNHSRRDERIRAFYEQLLSGPASSRISLKKLTIHFMDWQQREAIDIKGTPYRQAVPYVNAHGQHVTNNPRHDDMELEVRVSEPVRFVRPLDAEAILEQIFLGGWTASEIRLGGVDEAEEYPALRALADRATRTYQ